MGPTQPVDSLVANALDAGHAFIALATVKTHKIAQIVQERVTLINQLVAFVFLHVFTHGRGGTCLVFMSASVQYNSVPYGSVSLVGCSQLGPGLETLACAGITDNSTADTR